MDYSTPDGSTFSLSEVWLSADPSSSPTFSHTTISALVNGEPYAGKSPQPMDSLDESSLLPLLSPVPLDSIFPLYSPHFLRAPRFDPAEHYLKRPQFTYDDCSVEAGDDGAGKEGVAECFLNEITVLERLRGETGRGSEGIVRYYGCEVGGEGRVRGVCLGRCEGSLGERCERGMREEEVRRVIAHVREAVEFLHRFGLAHNDINVDNVCIDREGNAVLVDFDSCLPFGKPLLKGMDEVVNGEEDVPVSDRENDYSGLRNIEEFIRECNGAADE